MRWQAKHDRDAFKEVWLLFDNDQGRFPLYPGESVWIEYAYTVTVPRRGCGGGLPVAPGVGLAPAPEPDVAQSLGTQSFAVPASHVVRVLRQ
ncbi:hypothetical protein [Streptomyces sp. NPDC002845]